MEIMKDHSKKETQKGDLKQEDQVMRKVSIMDRKYLLKLEDLAKI